MWSVADRLIAEGAQAYERVVVGADPAAGAEISITVPGGEWWQVLSLTFSLVTDATVATRLPVLTLDDQTNVYCRVQPANSQAATLTITYNFIRDLGVDIRGASSLNYLDPFPPITLPPGHRIRTATTAMVAGDNYGAPTLYVAVIRPGGIGREPRALPASESEGV